MQWRRREQIHRMLLTLPTATEILQHITLSLYLYWERHLCLKAVVLNANYKLCYNTSNITVFKYLASWQLFIELTPKSVAVVCLLLHTSLHGDATDEQQWFHCSWSYNLANRGICLGLVTVVLVLSFWSYLGRGLYILVLLPKLAKTVKIIRFELIHNK